ncbi:putative metalloprotease CJM1_0395 family protein [Parvularcula lutaonensis]|uniref:Metalloprotease CJM1_0395 family protein n=1 Tax=Parvularcula lutaonensis TaxID=491923 RepID=A0ABV7MDX8_9PROT|nr:putative metalloprotease CJM1_0395 family protein [Parvularcula lutaonensis]GGY49298.1 hypothetical protein GCM10007148_17250 [Parvularcula lutaonensis]
MDLSAINPANARQQPVFDTGRFAAAPQGAVDGSRTETADAIQQTTRSERIGDRRNERQAGELTDEEQRVVQKLKARDREVRAHEQAHKLVGGQYAGAISYDLQRGPDGQDYAIGGSVPIDVSKEGSPEETAAKMRIVIRAALAPAEPSAADRAVAAAAQAKLLEAQAEISQQKAAERRGEAPESQFGSVLAAYAADQDRNADPVFAVVA